MATKDLKNHAGDHSEAVLIKKRCLECFNWILKLDAK